MCQGAKASGSEGSREREGQGANRPGSESSRERIGHGSIGQFAQGSELAQGRKGCESTTTTTITVLRHFFRDHPGEPVPEENFWTLWCKKHSGTYSLYLG